MNSFYDLPFGRWYLARGDEEFSELREQMTSFIDIHYKSVDASDDLKNMNAGVAVTKVLNTKAQALFDRVFGAGEWTPGLYRILRIAAEVYNANTVTQLREIFKTTSFAYAHDPSFTPDVVLLMRRLGLNEHDLFTGKISQLNDVALWSMGLHPIKDYKCLGVFALHAYCELFGLRRDMYVREERIEAIIEWIHPFVQLTSPITVRYLGRQDENIDLTTQMRVIHSLAPLNRKENVFFGHQVLALLKIDGDNYRVIDLVNAPNLIVTEPDCALVRSLYALDHYRLRSFISHRMSLLGYHESETTRRDKILKAEQLLKEHEIHSLETLRHNIETGAFTNLHFNPIMLATMSLFDEWSTALKIKPPLS